MAMPAGDRPNILLVMTDQHNARILGVQSSFVRTPNLDRLAAGGVVFDNFYCNSPLCAPSRASMVAGMLVSNLGTYDNAAELPATVPTFAHHLRRAGYETILSGKMHFVGPDQLHGFGQRLTTDICPSNFEWTPDWRKGLNHNLSLSVKGVGNPGPVTWSQQIEYDSEVQARALAAIREIGTRREGKRPFLLCVSYTHPHDPFVITPQYWDFYEGVEIPPPTAPPRPLEEMHPFNQWVQKRHRLDRFVPTEGDVMRARRAYCGMVSLIDEMVGQLIAELSRFSLLGNTIVIFTSDHGEMLGEHGMWFKRTFMEDALRVPFIVSWSGTWAGGRLLTEPASLVDLFPTLLEVADVGERDEIGRLIDGRSLVRMIESGADEPRTVISEFCAEGVLHPAIALIDGRFKYVYVQDCPPLLYDLGADPHEQANLAEREETRTIQSVLHGRVPAKWLDGTLDAEIRLSQRQRLWVRDVMRQCPCISWDFQPFTDAS